MEPVFATGDDSRTPAPDTSEETQPPPWAGEPHIDHVKSVAKFEVRYAQLVKERVKVNESGKKVWDDLTAWIPVSSVLTGVLSSLVHHNVSCNYMWAVSIFVIIYVLGLVGPFWIAHEKWLMLSDKEDKLNKAKQVLEWEVKDFLKPYICSSPTKADSATALAIVERMLAIIAHLKATESYTTFQKHFLYMFIFVGGKALVCGVSVLIICYVTLCGGFPLRQQDPSSQTNIGDPVACLTEFDSISPPISICDSNMDFLPSVHDDMFQSPKPYSLPKCSDCAPLFMKAECYHYLFDAADKLHPHGPIQNVSRTTCSKQNVQKQNDFSPFIGNVWKTGYETNELEGVVFDDVPEALKKLHSLGTKVYIYCSESRLAQRLKFGKTNYGDVSKYLCGYFDTTVGNRRQTRSYFEITKSLGVDKPSHILFVTDVVEEAVAARAAGLEVVTPTLRVPSTSHFWKSKTT